jgi:ABC-2 type transport system ATP-binding protein
MALIQVEHLTKRFRRQKQKAGFWGTVRALFSRDYETIVAVNDISFEIERGEIVGYIGPNGAGKSTTIKMLVGVLVPSSGYVKVADLVPCQNRVKNARHIGVVFGQRVQLWWDLPVSESLGLTRHMYGVSQRDYQATMDLLSDVLGMEELLHVLVRQLSLGQRMRAELCNALLHNPDVLFLDEPTIGLDVEVKERIRQFIRAVNRERSTQWF